VLSDLQRFLVMRFFHLITFAYLSKSRPSL
jgi:hypothetical protein